MSDFLTGFIAGDLDRHRPPHAGAATPSNCERPDDFSLYATVTGRGMAPEELVIPRFQATANNLVCKSIIFYGNSGTGKTTLLKHWAWIVRKAFPIVVAFAPTNEETHDYDGIIPDLLIHDDVKIDIIAKLYKRQQAVADAYKRANDPEVLYSLFRRVANRSEIQNVQHLENLRGQALATAREQYQNPFDRTRKCKDIEETFGKALNKCIKQIIEPHAQALLADKGLSDAERLAVRYRRLRPDALAIFDDTMTEILSLLKTKGAGGDQIRDFFFKGRHQKISHWYTFQDSLKLDSSIRKNAFISVFTTAQVALGFFSRTNGFSPMDIKRAEAAIGVVFNEENEQMGCKLVYNRMAKHKFQYAIAEEHGIFQMGSSALWQLSDTCAGGQQASDNAFVDKFRQ